MKTKILIAFSFLGLIVPKTFSQTDSIDYLGLTPPGNTPVVFARGIVSVDTTLNHSSPAFSPDGNEVFWWINRPPRVPGKLKETGTEHWKSPNTGATNESGFNGLPAGSHWGDGSFCCLGMYTHYWSATSAGEDMAYRHAQAYQYDEIVTTSSLWNTADKKNGWSIRCVEDHIADSLKYFGQTPPGNVPEQFAPGIITGFVHGRIAISPKGDEIFWTINPSTERIMYSQLENGIWINPVIAGFVKDYLINNNGSPSFTPDGERIFFSSNRTGGLGKSDAWYAEKTDSGWSNPINAGEPYNSENDETTPLFTKKSKAYLSAGLQYSKDPLCFIYSNDQFYSPTPWEVIPEYSPWWTIYISPEEDYLIFAGNADNADLFVQFKTEDGLWGTPLTMGDKINTSQWERFPVVSPDGNYLFFTRGGGTSANIYWVSTAIIDSLKNVSTTGAVQMDDQKIKLFPNPSAGQFTISYGANHPVRAKTEIYTTSGKLVYTSATYGSATETIDLTGFPNGIYLVKMITGNAYYQEKIALIQHN